VRAWGGTSHVQHAAQTERPLMPAYVPCSPQPGFLVGEAQRRVQQPAQLLLVHRYAAGPEQVHTWWPWLGGLLSARMVSYRDQQLHQGVGCEAEQAGARQQKDSMQARMV
jgi:hypothetical protein